MDTRKVLGADARLAALRLLARAEGDYALALDRLELDAVDGELDGLQYRAASLTADGCEVRLGGAHMTAEAASLGGLTLIASGGALRLAAARVGLTSGVSFTGNTELFAPHASLEDVTIEIDLAAARGRGARTDESADAPPGGAARDDGDAGERGDDGDRDRDDSHPGDDDHEHPDGAPADPPRRRVLDFHFLDALSGQLDLDLVVDITLPWIGRRRATHYFRIPIRDGAIDFEELEDDVHWLEGAFLDLELIDDKLVLERDLPLVPWSGKALLWWPLAPEEVALAQYQRVHIRNLFYPQRPPSKERKRTKSGKPKIKLHSISMEKARLTLDATSSAHLELGSGGLIQFGDDTEPGVIGLALAGALRYEAERASEARTPTNIAGGVQRLDLTVKDLPMGRARASADRIHIGDLEDVELVFRGFALQSLRGAIPRVAVTNLRIQLP